MYEIPSRKFLIFPAAVTKIEVLAFITMNSCSNNESLTIIAFESKNIKMENYKVFYGIIQKYTKIHITLQQYSAGMA